MDDELLDFNFWPAFADMMLSLVLILVLVLIAVVINFGNINLAEVKNNQQQMIDALAQKYGVEARTLDSTRPGEIVYGISTLRDNNTDIIITNKVTLQRITFGDNVLFEPDDDEIKPKGKEVLRLVGDVLNNQLTNIEEIQIQGHADPITTTKFESNLHLAAYRAMAVFNFLYKESKIHPVQHLMSATSFGEFKPVQRSDDNSPYNEDRLKADNETDPLKARNRRIELLLIYRQHGLSKPALSRIVSVK